MAQRTAQLDSEPAASLPRLVARPPHASSRSTEAAPAAHPAKSSRLDLATCDEGLNLGDGLGVLERRQQRFEFPAFAGADDQAEQVPPLNSEWKYQ